MHTILPFLLAMVAAVVLLEMWATKLRIAYPILLVVAGLLLSFIPSLPAVHINPDVIFFIFLPPLLFEASWSISFKEMKKWWRIIGSFAFLVVFITALSVAVIANHYLPGFSLALGFLLGGIVAPPDAVSTAAITKFVKIPRSLSTILEGESLLNDASALIILRFALLAVRTGQFIWHDALLSFSWMVAGGVGFGLLLAWLFVQMHKRLPTDASSDIALTLIEPYAIYWIAEQCHCSGVLAVVSGGLLLSAKRMEFLSSESRIKGFSVWESFVFILNGIVFLIIGLALPEIVEGLRAKGIPLSKAIGYGVAITGVLVLSRIVCAFGAMAATMIFRRSVVPKGTSARQMMQFPLVLGWSGMRGVVSLAAALSIPAELSDGTAFPQRNLILFITFIVILLTLVGQGLTLPQLINRWQPAITMPGEENADGAMQHHTQQQLKQHTYSFLKTKQERGELEMTGVNHMLQVWEERAKAENWQMNGQMKALFLEILESQRDYLSKLNEDEKIDEEIIRRQLYRIDLEEEKLKIV